MSANPRSPESGDVPEKDVAEMPDHLLVLSVVNASFDLGAWNRDTATTPYEVEVLRQRRYVNELHRRLAELSTARERADRAEQDSKRLDELEAARLELRLRVDPDEMIQVSRRGDDEVLQEYTLRDAADALMVSTPTPTPDHA